MEEVKKGPAFRCGDFEIIPIERWTRVEFQRGPLSVCHWSKEPLGIQVLGSAGRYALDMEGCRSEELLEL